MLTVVCSDKGSPGVTSSALAIAAAWPSPAALVEADAAGGDLGMRIRTAGGGVLPDNPTVATLAASARSVEDRGQLVIQYAFTINDQMSAIPGFLVAEQGDGMSGLWDELALTLADSDVDVIADVGRLQSGSPAMRIVEAADVVVVVARPNLVSVLRLRERIRRLIAARVEGRRAPVTIVPLLVAGHRHCAADVAEVAEILHVAGLATADPTYIAWDVAALAALEAGEDPRGRRLCRSPLMRSARPVAEQIASIGVAGVVAGSMR